VIQGAPGLVAIWRTGPDETRRPWEITEDDWAFCLGRIGYDVHFTTSLGWQQNGIRFAFTCISFQRQSRRGLRPEMSLQVSALP